MNQDNYQKIIKKSHVRRALFATLILGCAMGSGSAAVAQQLTPPPTSTKITPPAGSIEFLLGHATGTQGYVCLPTAVGATTASWTINSPRPEATLFQTFFGQPFQIITHFLSPNTNPKIIGPDPLPFGNATWQSSLDSSKVWAQAIGMAPAGSEESCPNANSIPCLLLQAVGSLDGPTGGKSLSKTSFIQRLNTKGGTAPADGCSVAGDVGKQVLVPYSADYLFYVTPSK
jgi:hypothetical protein